MSHSKPKQRTQTQAHLLLPTAAALLQSPTSLGVNKRTSPQGFSTPRSSPDDDPFPPHKCSHAKSVQFGTTQAAEYDLEAPAVKFTPLPAEIARERFPLTRQTEYEEGEEEEIAETKVNSALLAEWEGDFDSFVEEEEVDDDEEEKQAKERELPRHGRKRHSSKRDRSNRRHSKSGGSSNSKRSERRRSSAFCSPGQAKVLYDPDSDTEATPNKKSSAAMLDHMADLSMKSPAQAQPSNEPERDDARSNHQKLSEESADVSPVVARNLAIESPPSTLGTEEATMVDVKPHTVAPHESPPMVKMPQKRKKVRVCREDSASLLLSFVP